MDNLAVPFFNDRKCHSFTHLPSLKIAHVAAVLAYGIAAAVQDRREFDRWQALAWVVSQRQNVAERLTWRAQIPALMAALCP